MDDKKKIDVKDAHLLDKRVPRDLIIMYQNRPYITKGGLCWKMNHLFGGGNWGITSKILTNEPDHVLIESTLKLSNGVEFNNYGEASLSNVTNPMMRKHMLHLAITRAENRVMRTATASGYTSVDEMDFNGENVKEIPEEDTDDQKPTPNQLEAIKNMGIKEKPKTQKRAKELITGLINKK